MIGSSQRMPFRTFSLSQRANLRRAVILAVLGTLTFLAILKLSGFKASWEKFRALDPRYIVAAFAVYYFSFCVRALRWKLLLRVLGQKLSATTLFSYLLVGWFVSAVLPARGGDVVRAYLLRSDRKIPLRAGVSSIFVERGLDGLVILSCSFILSFFIISLALPRWILILYQVSFSIFLLLLAFLYLVPRLEAKVGTLFPSARYQKLVFFLFRLLDNVRLIAKSWRQLIIALSFTLVIWFCDALVTYLVILSLNYTLPLPWVAFISFTVNLVAIIPITPGAVGQIDAALFSLFSFLGVARGFAGVTVLINRFIGYWSFLLVSGLVTYGSGLTRLIRMMSARKEFIGTPLEPASLAKRMVPEVPNYPDTD